MASLLDTTHDEASGAEVDPLSLLLVEDEAVFARAVRKRLEREGYRCRWVETLHAAEAALAEALPDLILLDIKLPDGSGLAFLARLRERQPEALPVVIMTAFGDVESAVEAMRLDALDYLKKPIDLDELVLFLQKAVRDLALAQSQRHAQVRQDHALGGLQLVGASPPMRLMVDQLRQIARLGVTGGEPPPSVLIQGETGTGKDVAARLLHSLSGRRERPLVHVDCAALPKELIEAELFGHEKGSFTSAHSSRTGLIEAAEDGTLFLDEIGEVPLELQAKLLAVLERRRLRRVGSSRELPTEAWFVAATNRPLAEMVEAGRFRADLYYRLNVLTVAVPPLRTRGGDAGELAHHFVARTAARFGLAPPALAESALAAIERYRWPGNVRELKHVIERAVLLNRGGELRATDLALELPDAPTAAAEDVLLDGVTLDEMERRMIAHALERTGGNVSEAARRLGVTRMVLRYRIDKHGLRAAARG